MEAERCLLVITGVYLVPEFQKVQTGGNGKGVCLALKKVQYIDFRVPIKRKKCLYTIRRV